MALRWEMKNGVARGCGVFGKPGLVSVQSSPAFEADDGVLVL